MKNLRLHILTSLLLGTFVAAGGCSRHDRNASVPQLAPAPAYTAVARGRVDIEDGLLQLNAVQPGIADTVLVHAGDHVRRGQPLLTLQSRDAEIAVTIAAGRMVEAQAQARLLKDKLDDARRRAGMLSEAAAAGADAGQNALDAESQVHQLVAQWAAAMAAVTVAQGQLDQARFALDQHTLHAPISGEVLEVKVQAGQTVSPQSGALFTLMPAKPHIIVAELSGDYVGKVHAGMQAVVVLDDDAEQEVGRAHVARVDKMFGKSGLEDDPAVRNDARTVKCVLDFDRSTRLRIGQRVLVKILPDSSRAR